MTEQKCRQSEIWGAFVVEDWSCWAEEGAGVNYSITGWLSQELFKQTPASRGLGLITTAKVTPTTLPYCLLLHSGEYSYGGRRGEYMKEKEIKTKQRQKDR